MGNCRTQLLHRVPVDPSVALNSAADERSYGNRGTVMAARTGGSGKQRRSLFFGGRRSRCLAVCLERFGNPLQ